MGKDSPMAREKAAVQFGAKTQVAEGAYLNDR